MRDKNNLYENMDNKRMKLVPLTVRINPDVHKALSDISDKSSKPIAEIVRYIVDVRIANYLKSVEFISDEKAYDIVYRLNRWLVELRGYRGQLWRYGVNYNQLLKLKNIRRKSNVIFEKESEGEDIALANNILKIEVDEILPYLDYICLKVERLGTVLEKYTKGDF